MGSADGGRLGIRKVINKGPDADRWNLLIFAEGYKKSDVGAGSKFDQDAQALFTELLTVSPFGEFKSAINLFLVDTWSIDSGAFLPTCGGLPAGPAKRTYFDSSWCNFGRLEYLSVNADAVKLEAATLKPQYDAIIVLVNENSYGGSGDRHVAVCTREVTTRRLVAHELGHAAFKLADEYESSGRVHSTTEPQAANVTVKLTTLKWTKTPGVPIPSRRNQGCAQLMQNPAVPVGAVGAFEGGRNYECNVYRPSLTCMMRDWSSDFCKVCKAEIRARLTPFLP
jgi:hypothetical protein